MNNARKPLPLNGIVASALAIALLGLCTCGGTKAPADFSGYWVWSDPGNFFNITLKAEGTKVTGWHKAGHNDGTKGEAVLKSEEPSINGTIDGTVAKLTIKSPSSPEAIHEAIMTIGGIDEAAWKIVKRAPGESYIPLEAKLLRRPIVGEPEEKTSKQDLAAEEAIIASARALKESIQADIERLGIEPVTKEETDFHRAGTAMIYKNGDRLLMMNVTRPNDTGSLSSTYWFGPGNSLKLVEETSFDVAMAGQTPKTSQWFFNGNNLLCARDGDGNSISIDSSEATFIRKAKDWDFGQFENS